MTPAISVLADRYRPRKSTAERGRAFGRAATFWGAAAGFWLFVLLIMAIGDVVNFVRAII